MAHIASPISDDFWSERLKFSDRQMNIGSGQLVQSRQKVVAYMLKGAPKSKTGSIPLVDQHKVESVGVIDAPFMAKVEYRGTISVICKKLPHFHPNLSSHQRSLVKGNLQHLNEGELRFLAEHELQEPEVLKIIAEVLEAGNLPPDELRERVLNFLRYQTFAKWKDVLAGINRGIYCAMVAKIDFTQQESRNKWASFLGHIGQSAALSDWAREESRQEIMKAIQAGKGAKIIQGLQKYFPNTVPQTVALFDLSDLRARFSDAERSIQTSLDPSIGQVVKADFLPIYDPDYDEIRFVPRSIFNKFCAACLPDEQNPQQEMLEIVIDRLEKIAKDPVAAAQELGTISQVTTLLRNLYCLAQSKDCLINDRLLVLVLELSKYGRSLASEPDERTEFFKTVAAFETLYPTTFRLKQESIHILGTIAEASVIAVPKKKSEVLAKLELETQNSFEEICAHLEKLLQLTDRGKLLPDNFLMEDVIALSSKARNLAEAAFLNADELSDAQIADIVVALERIAETVSAFDNLYQHRAALLKEESLLILQASSTGIAHRLVSGRLEKLTLRYVESARAQESTPVLLHTYPTWAERYIALLAVGKFSSDLQKVLRMREMELSASCVEILHEVDHELYALSTKAVQAVEEIVIEKQAAFSPVRAGKIARDCLSSLQGSCLRIARALSTFPAELRQTLNYPNLLVIHRFLQEIYDLLVTNLEFYEVEPSAVAEANFHALGQNYIRFQKEIEEKLLAILFSGILCHPGRANPVQYAKSIQSLARHLSRKLDTNIPSNSCDLYQEVVQLLQSRLWMPLVEFIKITEDQETREALTKVLNMLKGIASRANTAFQAT